MWANRAWYNGGAQSRRKACLPFGIKAKRGFPACFSVFSLSQPRPWLIAPSPLNRGTEVRRGGEVGHPAGD